MMKEYQKLFRFESRLWVGLIALAAVVVWARQIHVGGFSWSDAPLHAMDGVFVHDLVQAHPTGQLHAWAERYFAKYPCLGFVVFYPPFFAAVESGLYSLAGISVFSARLTVILFGVVGVLAMYWVARQLFDHAAGVIAAGLWASLPTTVLWSRQVMLEVPMTAMILVCCGCYLRYVETKKLPWLVLTGLAFIAAAMTKQWAAFIGLVLVADLVRRVGIKKAVASPNILVLGSSLLLVGAYMVISSQYAALSKFLVRGHVAWRHLISPEHWWFYIRAFPDCLGWPMLGFALLGFLLAASTRQIKKIRLPLLWVVIFYFFASVIAYKETRYFYPVTAAGVLLAVGGLAHGLEKTRLKTTGFIILSLVIFFQFFNGWRQDPQRLADYEPAARLIHERSDSRLVLIDATREGQFIFDLRRRQGPEGNVFTLRASKLLFSRAARRQWQYTEYVKDESDILRQIQKYAIRYVVVESGPPNVPDWREYFPPPSEWLRKLLYDRRRFEKLAEFPIGQTSAYRGVNLEVYRYTGPLPESADRLTIPMPSMGRDLEIALPKQ